MAFWATSLLLSFGLTACQSSPAQDSIQPATQALDRLLAAHVPAKLTAWELPKPDASKAWKLLVLSHAYGSPEVAKRGRLLPAESLTKQIPALAKRQPDLVVSLGDFVFQASPASVQASTNAFQKFGAPMLNAVGNHEMVGRKEYTERFGSTFGALRLGNNLLFILDTELQPWSISKEQVQLIRECLALAPKAGIKRALLFAHKLVFSVGNARYAPLLAKANAFDHWQGESNFGEEVLPLLRAFAQRDKEVLWFGGDIGVPWSYGLFFDRDPVSGITFVCTGLGDMPSDNIIQLVLPEHGPAQLEALPLTSTPLPALSACGPESWAKRFPDWRKRLPKLKDR